MKRFACALAIPYLSLFLTTVASHPQQTSLPSQTTTGACSPIFNGSGNVNNCNTPPGDRVILLTNAKQAIAVLNRVPSPSKVSFTVVGGSPEITSFANSIITMFAAAHWDYNVERAGHVMTTEPDGSTDSGEGLICVGFSGSPAYEYARAALAAAGHPCKAYQIRRSASDLKSVDETVSITIGTRIVPSN